MRCVFLLVNMNGTKAETLEKKIKKNERTSDVLGFWAN